MSSGDISLNQSSKEVGKQPYRLAQNNNFYSQNICTYISYFDIKFSGITHTQNVVILVLKKLTKIGGFSGKIDGLNLDPICGG